jgi:hypothetical protein
MIDTKSMKWEELVTNESLDAIMLGLGINEKDRVLSPGGSGDQDFAMLEKAEKVFVSDIETTALDFIRYRAGLLLSGNYEEFLDPGFEVKDELARRDFDRRRKYFQMERLERIRARLDDLHLLPPGPIQKCLSGPVTKIYLSNVLTYSGCPREYLGFQGLRFFTDRLEAGGLIYVASFDPYPLRKRFFKPKLPAGLEIDVSLTEKVREIQEAQTGTITSWVPSVFRKVV